MLDFTKRRVIVDLRKAIFCDPPLHSSGTPTRSARGTQIAILICVPVVARSACLRIDLSGFRDLRHRGRFRGAVYDGLPTVLQNSAVARGYTVRNIAQHVRQPRDERPVATDVIDTHILLPRRQWHNHSGSHQRPQRQRHRRLQRRQDAHRGPLADFHGSSH